MSKTQRQADQDARLMAELNGWSEDTGAARTSPVVKLLAILIALAVISLFVRTCFGTMV